MAPVSGGTGSWLSRRASNFTAATLKLAISPAIGGSISVSSGPAEDGEPFPLMRGSHSDSTNVLERRLLPAGAVRQPHSRQPIPSFAAAKSCCAPNMAGDCQCRCTARAGCNPWQILFADETGSRAWLIEHEAGEWPWTYEARQHFALDEAGLTVALSCFNTSTEPMPCGLGQHPYFPCGPETRIDTQVACAWEIDEAVLPVARVPATGRFDLRDRSVCGQELDHGFGGWGRNGAIQRSRPGRSVLEMSSPERAVFPALFATSRRPVRRRTGHAMPMRR